ncbi:MAG: sulfotransferase family protein [Limnothrix sp. RL_2_0]|nr:sulfotransferase family protein [Limnothrix sp. RL_2_0]
MTISVIGAGMGRTGTYSLKIALEMLGFGRCDHRVELLRQPERIGYWEGVAQGEVIDWDGLFEGFQAIADFPSHCFYEKLADQYPAAKVILTERSPDEWYASTKATLFRAEPNAVQKAKVAWKIPFSPELRQRIRIFRLVNQLIWQGDFGGNFLDKDQAIAAYLRHNEKVKATIPAARLLVYDVTQGWPPLCEFLAVSPPDEPFPHVNKRADFQLLKGRVSKLLP